MYTSGRNTLFFFEYLSCHKCKADINKPARTNIKMVSESTLDVTVVHAALCYSVRTKLGTNTIQGTGMSTKAPHCTTQLTVSGAMLYNPAYCHQGPPRATRCTCQGPCCTTQLTVSVWSPGATRCTIQFTANRGHVGSIHRGHRTTC